MIRRLLPKSVVGQLMALLTAVLIIAQIINLALLVGTQRIQARNNAFTASVEQAARLLGQLPLDARLVAQLPLDEISQTSFDIDPGRGGPRGSFFLSEDNRAVEFEIGKNLPRYNALFRQRLEDNGVVPLTTSVIFLEKSPYLIPPTDGSGRPPPMGPGQPPPMGMGLDPQTEAVAGQPPPMGMGMGMGPFPQNEAVAAQGEAGVGQPPPIGMGPRPQTETQGTQGPPIGGLPPGFPGQADTTQSLQEIRLSAQLENGIWYNALMPHEATETLGTRIFVATFLFLGLSLFAVWVFARQISRPISAFAEAAEDLGQGKATDFLPESGPEDMRNAAMAFNTMQRRLTRMLETQRNMLRAVGHDLRTPLTFLRLRAENIPNETERNKIIATLNDMNIMTEEILSWAQDASGAEEVANVDLGSFLESIVDNYEDQGQTVTLTPFSQITIHIRRVSVKRALQNLINNALKYGGNAALRVEQTADRVIINIEDDGPGISKTQLEEVLKPFVRLETSRSKETGGTGLGLSIADTIAQIHGGKLILSNRPTGGLRASFSLPK